MTSVNCPSCHEENTTDMAFCIYCGAPLKAVVPGPAGSANAALGVGGMTSAGAGAPTGSQRMSGAATRARFCTSCGQADSLNRQFCIFCGAKVEEPLVAGTPAAPPRTGPSVDRISAISEAAMAETPRRSSSKTTGAVAMVFAALFGTTLGLGLSWYYNNQPGPAHIPVQLPQHGLVLLTAQPNSFFEVTSANRRRFLSGKTGMNGDVAMEDLDPGEYHVAVKSPDGELWEKDVRVGDSDPLVIGAPPERELFSKQL